MMSLDLSKAMVFPWFHGYYGAMLPWCYQIPEADDAYSNPDFTWARRVYAPGSMIYTYGAHNHVQTPTP